MFIEGKNIYTVGQFEPKRGKNIGMNFKGMMTSGLESSLVVCQLIITRLYEKKKVQIN